VRGLPDQLGRYEQDPAHFLLSDVAQA
jgi:hypothetical protein